MKIRRYIIASLLSLLLLWSYTATAYAQGGALGNVVIQQGQTLQEDIATTSEAVVVDGEVLGDVTTWSGSITINGHVSGDVVSYSGNILLGTAAQVDGNILTVGGIVEGKESAQALRGQLLEGTPGGNAIAGLMTVIAPTAGDVVVLEGFERGLFSVAALFLLVGLATVATLLWPRRTTATSLTLRAFPWRSFALGALTTALLALLLVPLGALLAVTLLGLPLLLPLLLLLHLPYVYGLATVGQSIGHRFAPRQREMATVAGVLVLALPLALLGIVAPLLSIVLFYIVASLGLGATILSRAGTVVTS